MNFIDNVFTTYLENYELDPVSKSHIERLQGLLHMEMNGKQCPLCEASLKSYWHKITPMLVHALVKMKTAICEKGANRIHLQEDLSLSKTEYNNFQKLRFHGLIAKCWEEDKSRDYGFWLITKRGNDFLKGEVSIPSRVKTFRNHVIDHDKKLIKVSEVIGEVLYCEDINSLVFDFASL